MLIDSTKKYTKTISAKIILVLLLCGLGGLGGYYAWQSSSSVSQHQAPSEIRGSVITLKELKEEHFMPLYHMFSNDVRKGLEFPAVIDFGYMIAYLRELENRAKNHNGIHYVIFDNKDNLPIGSIEVRGYEPTDVGQLGCWLNENYRGQGRIQEAIKLISKAYFEKYPNETSFLGWARIWNQRSYKALKKAGLVDDTYIYHNGKPAYYQLKMHKA
jgi:RimJ/RimL family protein N-acetyltransferase